MSEVISAVSLIASISVTISMAWYVKKSLSTDSLIEKIEDISDEIMTNKELQAKIYTIGALLGNGIKQGIGLSGNARAPRGIEGIIGQLAGPILQKIFKTDNNQPQQQQGEFKPWDAPQ